MYRYIRQWYHIASGTTVRGKYLVACTSHNGGISNAERPEAALHCGFRISEADSTIVAYVAAYVAAYVEAYVAGES